MKSYENTYIIEVRYDENTLTPHKIFTAISDVIISFDQLNKSFSNMISSEIEPIIVLEGIEKGSIKIILKDILTKIPDSAIEDLNPKKILGAYLVKAKYILLEKMNTKDTFKNESELEEIEDELLNEAKKTNLLPFDDYYKIDRKGLLLGMKNISETMKELPEGTDFSYSSELGNTSIGKNFNITSEKIDELIIKKEISNTQEMILKVKKPDYLGNSQWELKHGTKLISAKITDYDWLKNFHFREIDIRPGDCLISKVDIIFSYDENMNLINEKYIIVEVKDIIQDNPNTEQLKI